MEISTDFAEDLLSVIADTTWQRDRFAAKGEKSAAESLIQEYAQRTLDGFKELAIATHRLVGEEIGTPIGDDATRLAEKLTLATEKPGGAAVILEKLLALKPKAENGMFLHVQKLNRFFTTHKDTIDALTAAAKHDPLPFADAIVLEPEATASLTA